MQIFTNIFIHSLISIQWLCIECLIECARSCNSHKIRKLRFLSSKSFCFLRKGNQANYWKNSTVLLIIGSKKKKTSHALFHCTSLCRTWQILAFWFYKLKAMVNLHQASLLVPFFQHHLLSSHLCSHFGNSHNISDIFIIIIFVMVICDSLKAQGMVSTF